MKFAVVVVLVALALGANSSVIPIGLHGAVLVGHPHAAVTIAESPLSVSHVVADHGSVAVHASSIPTVHAVHGIHGIHGIHGLPAVSAVHGLHAVHASPVQILHHAVPAAATSVSKNRGAVHVAPLPGHTQSVVSANLAPAPGTL